MLRKIALTLLAFILSLAASAAAWGQSPETIMKEAEQLYQEEQFASASAKYLQIINNGYESAPLYYNIGNAYYRTGKLGPAILYFRKAQKLAPKDPEIAENLAYCRTLVVDESAPEARLMNSWMSELPWRFGFFEMCAAACVVFFIAILFFCVNIYFDSPALKTFSRRAGWLLIVIWITISSTIVYRIDSEKKSPAGVILSSRVEALAGPGESYSAVFILHEGAEVQIRKTKDDWYQISYPSVGAGWVKKSSIGEI